MTSLEICEDDIPSLYGKRVIITGASSGIGQAAATIFAQKGASVLNLDVNPPEGRPHERVEYRQCDVSDWDSLRSAFQNAGDIDIAVSNAGVSEETDYFADTFDPATGELLEPQYRVLDVNLRAVLNFAKLAISHFRRRKHAGSIVITSSATAYAPEQSLPVYSASKLALIGLVRSLRSALLPENITVNAIAPAATITSLLPKHLAAPIIASGLPVSSAEFVGLAIVYSSVASQSHPVELYGKDNNSSGQSPSRWNGRTILTLGAHYTELEEPIAALRPQWFGAENTELTRLQQAATDFRTFV
ncbi:insect type alcohol dehydrogenase ADH-like classical c SDR [Aspergillus parasiticus SU-1]|uniref:Short chain dehydrogenase reductase n=2 Tax=Aspergillus parasiticus TaxID=5067 RepID=A0A5N6DX63_ASPPA|nr:short chain dehydrogenase reductase [Aspergillus parasiticus]KJK60885.1 insect type alcohol dehydrogenase ADH-like classical c SDR [Aspergillus parasiticus SU-1]